MASIDAQDVARGADAAKLAPPPVVDVERYGADGDNMLVDRNNLIPLLTVFDELLDAHVAAAAEDLGDHVRQTLESEGGHAGEKWPEKSEPAAEWAGTFELWKGRTRTLRDNLDTRDPNQGPLSSGQVSDHARAVGWFQETHPDPGIMEGGRLAPKLSVGELAAVHEFGVEQLGDTGIFEVPKRPALIPTVEKYGDDVMREMMVAIVDSVTDFNELGEFRFAGAGNVGGV